jgi:hypothetical protein
MTNLSLTWKGQADSEAGVAMFTSGELSVAVDLPNFTQAHALNTFIHASMHRAATAKVRATSATIKGLLDAIT